MNQSKAKGTSFETNVVRYLQAELEDDRIERRALHGAHDRGDVYGIRAHGLHGIAECKDHKTYADGLLRAWERQTLAERDNADADFALLVIHRRGKSAKWTQPSFGQNIVRLTVADLMRIGGRWEARQNYDDDEFMWCSMTLADAVCLMRGGRKDD